SYLPRPLPRSTLFPYTTLFRSRVARLPRPLRRWAWWVGLNASGRERVRHFGTFGVTAMAGTGSTSFHVLSPLTAMLFYGLFDAEDRKSTRLNSSHVSTSYAVFC